MDLINPANIEAIITDVDGTLLLPNSTLSEETISVVRNVIERYPNLHFFFATGKNQEATTHLRDTLFPGSIRQGIPGVFMNGGLSFGGSGELLHSVQLPVAVSLENFEFAEKLGLVLCFYSLGRVLSTRHSNFTEFHLHQELKEPLVEIVEPHTLKRMIETGEFVVYKLIYCCDENQDISIGTEGSDEESTAENVSKKCDKNIWYLKKMLETKLVSKAGVDFKITSALSFVLEVLPIGSGKKDAISKVLENINCNSKNVLAFGDGEN
ncbi:hypothetical protein HK096_001262, partial [Nowakowskiella sp. JEL0078]